MRKGNWTIIKLGGSILSPDPGKAKTNKFSDYRIPFDYDFSIKFLKLLKKFQDQKLINRVVLIIGGGYLNKSYLIATTDYIQKRMQRCKKISNDLKDMIGSASIALNAHVFLSIATSLFGDKYVYQDTLKYSDYDKLGSKRIPAENRLVIAAACGPGHSSDTNTMTIAKAFKSDSIISLKNVDGVYDSDPSKNSKAKKYDKLTWKEYKDILGEAKYEPRSHFPVDVVATDMADETNTDFVIMNGKDIENFGNYMKGKIFIGTIITNK